MTEKTPTDTYILVGRVPGQGAGHSLASPPRVRIALFVGNCVVCGGLGVLWWFGWVWGVWSGLLWGVFLRGGVRFVYVWGVCLSRI